jgi:hypothetical protein
MPFNKFLACFLLGPILQSLPLVICPPKTDPKSGESGSPGKGARPGAIPAGRGGVQNFSRVSNLGTGWYPKSDQAGTREQENIRALFKSI